MSLSCLTPCPQALISAARAVAQSSDDFVESIGEFGFVLSIPQEKQNQEEEQERERERERRMLGLGRRSMQLE